MALPDLDPSRALELLFGDILAYVEEASALIAKREPLLLAGLDTAVDALCERVKEMSPEASKEYAPELEHLMERITQLQTAMIAIQEEVSTTLKSMSVQQKANRAYTTKSTESEWK